MSRPDPPAADKTQREPRNDQHNASLPGSLVLPASCGTGKVLAAGQCQPLADRPRRRLAGGLGASGLELAAGSLQAPGASARPAEGLQVPSLAQCRAPEDLPGLSRWKTLLNLKALRVKATRRACHRPTTVREGWGVSVLRSLPGSLGTKDNREALPGGLGTKDNREGLKAGPNTRFALVGSKLN